MYRKAAWVFVFIFVLTGLAYSADIAGRERDEARRREKAQERARLQEQEMMELIKKENPEEYKRIKASQELSGQINAIVSDFYAGKISYDAAKSSLRPLVKKSLEAQAVNTDVQIKELQRQIAELQGLKNDIAAAVDKDIDIRLGKDQP